MAIAEQSTYLNDHLAGASAAIDLLDALADDDENGSFQELITRLTVDITSDRDVLVAAMGRIGVEPGAIKQIGGRLGEKAMRAKSSEAVTRSPALTGLQRTEALIVGISGKIALWTSLNASRDPRLSDIDFDALITSAQNQQAQLEPFRVKAANAVFDRG